MTAKADSPTPSATASAAGWPARRAQALPRGLSHVHPIYVDRAEGCTIWDDQGRAYLDGMAGIGVLNVGSCHPKVVAAVEAQAHKFLHLCMQTVPYAPYVELAERLAALVPGDFPKKAVFVNSGAEAVENAVKIARAATGRQAVLALTHAFHGRTYMALALTDKAHGYKEGFAPFPAEVYRAPSGYAYRCPAGRAACREEGTSACDGSCAAGAQHVAEVSLAGNLAAVIVEPIQGEGGFIPMAPAFLRQLRELCDRTGALLIADEIQCGMGRTGRMFAIEHSGVVPDLTLVAKSLAGGLPLAAVVGRAEVMDQVLPGGLGSTFGGNPVAVAAALAVLDVMAEEDLPGRARRLGARFMEVLGPLRRRLPRLGDVRGMGLMIGLEVVEPGPDRRPDPEGASRVVDACRRHGLLLMKAGVYDHVVRLLPPLVLTDAEAEQFLERLTAGLEEALA